MTLFEEFLDYCSQDNKKLRCEIECWLCDFFDLPNRNIRLDKEEKKWISENLSKKSQERILGMTPKEFEEKFVVIFTDKDGSRRSKIVIE